MSAAALRRLILVLNTAGSLVFLGWLVFSRERILYTQEGVIYVLPALPLFFVYMFLLRRPPPPEDRDDTD